MRVNGILVIVAALSATTLAACGDDTEKAAPDGATALRVLGFPTVSDTLITKVAIEQGFFAEAGLEVEFVDQPPALDLFQGLAATKSDIVPASMASFSAGVSAGNDGYALFCGAQPTNPFSIVASPDTDLPSTEDGVRGADVLRSLSGKTVGTLTPVGSGIHKLFATALEEAGATDVEFISTGNDPRVVKAALDRGQVQAAVTTSTTTEALEASGAVVNLVQMWQQEDISMYHDLYGSAFVASQEALDADPEAYEAFCRVLGQSLDYITGAEPADEAAMLQEHIGLSPDVAQQVVEAGVMERYDPELDKEKILSTFDTYAEIGVLESRLDNPDALIHEFE